MAFIFTQPTLKDLPRLAEIINQSIRKKYLVGLIDEFNPEIMVDWFKKHTGKTKYPIIVAKDGDEIVGWSILRKYREEFNTIFTLTAETQGFLDFNYQKKGLGKAMLEETLRVAKNLGFKSVHCPIINKNIAGISLLRRVGFERWGFFPKVGIIDGEEIDHIYFGKKL